MTRKATGGNIRHHATRDLWEARYVGADGRRHSVYGKTRREAQERLRTALTAADHGIRPLGQQLTVSTYLADWLTGSVAARCRPRTVESYRDTVRRYIAPAVGRIPLAKLEPADIAAMLRAVAARNVSPTTVRYAYVVLRVALGRALKEGRVIRNVATLIDPPKRAQIEMHPLTGDQARAFLAAVFDARLGPLYTLAIATGMRQGELLALRWQDVDSEAGIVSVRHTLQEGTRELAETKTARGKRTLRVGSQAVAALREQRRRQLAERFAAGRRWRDAGFVFTSTVGSALDARSVTHQLQTALDRAGLPRQRFHDLRHAYATLMLEAGEDLSVVSRSLGHAALSTTADVYAHLTPAMLERSAARMDGILASRKTV